MAGDSWDQLGDRPCKHLRSKEMFYESETARDARFASGIFWCARTERCLGPDGLTADDEDCGPERACFER